MHERGNPRLFLFRILVTNLSINTTELLFPLELYFTTFYCIGMLQSYKIIIFVAPVSYAVLKRHEIKLAWAKFCKALKMHKFGCSITK